VSYTGSFYKTRRETLEKAVSADTSIASTPVSNPIACTADWGGGAGEMWEATSMAIWGIRMHLFAYICSQDIYMHFTNPVPDFKSENIVGDRGCRGAAPSPRPLPRIVFVSRALEVAC